MVVEVVMGGELGEGMVKRAEVERRIVSVIVILDW